MPPSSGCRGAGKGMLQDQRWSLVLIEDQGDTSSGEGADARWAGLGCR